MFRIESVNENNFKDIPGMCKYCLYWQTSGEFSEDMAKPEMEQHKREWMSRIVKRFGSCMKIAYLNTAPIGYVQYAPAKFLPQSKVYVSGPPSEDAVLIACLYVANNGLRGKGFGTAMLKDLLAEFKKKGWKAVETFARKNSENNPSGPLKLYLKQGFTIKREANDFPLLRLEL
jgi:hypothetical protein